LTDEDVGAEVDDLAEDEAGGSGMATKTRMAMGELIDELVRLILTKRKRADEQLNNSLLDLLVANLSRLDEKEDTDSQGVFHILGVLENLLSFMPPLAEQIVENTTLLPWLLKRVSQKAYDSNKQYASEILSIILQEGRSIALKVGELEGVDTFLQIVAVRHIPFVKKKADNEAL
jgi:beta-catenin-like protein 1